MNKAITDGLVLMPPAFKTGLDLWSSEDGTPGSATYAGAANAAIATADQDFGDCLELAKAQATQKLRYTGDTPILPGCYLRISARVKAVSGNLPAVRVGAWAGGSGNAHVGGLTETGPSVQLAAYGEVVTVSAIVGTGSRGGVDMAWGTQPHFGHFGLDLTGANGGVVRIEDLAIEDVTGVFHRKMMDWVDVRDYGATGDGATDDRAAFLAADADAAGREVLVSAGTYYIGSDLSMNAPVRFEGRLVMPETARLALISSYDLPTYADAFGNELLGFRKALQALFAFTDHNALDLRGRRIEVDAPIDVAALVPGTSTWSNRRVIRNGQFNVIDSAAWTPVAVTSQATYNSASPTTLTGVINVANVPVGARVSGAGVGREVYVTARNVGASTLTLSQPLYGGSGTQVLTFTRYRYVLDFSGFAQLDRFNVSDVEFLCNGIASGILLAPAGETFHLRDCYMVRPRDRGVTSIGTGCQDLLIDRCQFISNESGLRAQDRTTVALNVNANDIKIRENRFVRFGHTMVVNGNGHMIVGNHWFQGDNEIDGVRVGGLILTTTNTKTLVVANYIDNCFVEWTNEYEADPDLGSQYTFGGLTLTGNIFTANDVASWFRWIVVKPYGLGHGIQGLTVTGNVFKALNGPIDRVEGIDSTFATLDFSRMRNVVFEANSFNAITQPTVSPVLIEHQQATEAASWAVAAGGYLPFGGWARNVESIVAEGMITNAAGQRVGEMPYAAVEQGSARDQVTLNWSVPVKGRVQVKLRTDNPN